MSSLIETARAIWDALSILLPGNSDILKDVIKTILVTLVVGGLLWFSRRLYRMLRDAVGKIDISCCWRVRRARTAVARGGQGLWLAHFAKPPADYDDWMSSSSSFVMTVANDKGGVGKTTTTVNLAAAFAKRMTKPVLVIDLDPQGSASAQMFAGQDWRPKNGKFSLASLAIDGEQSPNWLASEASAAQPITWRNSQRATVKSDSMYGLGAFYDLIEFEDRALTEWLLGDRNRDVRYDLFRLIRAPAVRAKFGAILIDAPPRFSVSSVQALCASTHVLIPTILDNTSANAVGYFARRLREHEALWPKLKVIGVLGTMTEALADEDGALGTARDAVRDALKSTRTDLNYLDANGKDVVIPYELSVPQKAVIARTGGDGIAYLCLGQNQAAASVRKIFDDVAAELQRRM